MNNNTISVVFADSSHAHYAPRICDLIYESALQRGTGIAKRSPEYIAAKMTGGKAVVALDGEKLIGFSYIECWGHGDFVATALPPVIFAAMYSGERLAMPVPRCNADS